MRNRLCEFLVAPSQKRIGRGIDMMKIFLMPSIFIFIFGLIYYLKYNAEEKKMRIEQEQSAIEIIDKMEIKGNRLFVPQVTGRDEKGLKIINKVTLPYAYGSYAIFERGNQ